MADHPDVVSEHGADDFEADFDGLSKFVQLENSISTSLDSGVVDKWRKSQTVKKRERAFQTNTLNSISNIKSTSNKSDQKISNKSN